MKNIKNIFIAILVILIAYYGYCVYENILPKSLKIIFKFFFDNILAIFISVYVIDKITSARDKKQWKPVMDIFSKNLLDVIDNTILLLTPDKYEKIVKININFGFTSHIIQHDVDSNLFNNVNSDIIINDFYHQKEILKKSLPNYISILDNILSTPTKFEPNIISNIIEISNLLKDLLEVVNSSHDFSSDTDYNKTLSTIIVNGIKTIKKTREEIIKEYI